MTAAKEERRLLGYRVKDVTDGTYLLEPAVSGYVGFGPASAAPPVVRPDAVARLGKKLMTHSYYFDRLRIVRVHAKPKAKPAPERKSLAQIDFEAREVLAKEIQFTLTWDEQPNEWREVSQAGAIAVAEEVRRRFRERWTNGELVWPALDAIIAEAKEGK